MAMIRWDPFHYMDNVFDESFAPFPMHKLGWDLAVDVYEEDNNVIAKMNLPGIDPEKLDISIDDDILTVKGTREEEEETKKKHYYSKEIRKGSFERSVRLSAEVEASKADAQYKDGVLTITIPKKLEQRRDTHKIKVRT